jgi:hypothetical protein
MEGVKKRMPLLQTNLIGLHASWHDSSRGYQEGTIVAVNANQYGDFTLLVNTDRGVVQKQAEGVSIR